MRRVWHRIGSPKTSSAYVGTNRSIFAEELRRNGQGALLEVDAEGRVHVAGDHTSHMPGWMHGALASAKRVVTEVS